LRLLIGIRILVGSGLILASLITNFSSEHLEIQKLEFGWTVVPAIILLMLAFPSIKALYYLDEVMKRIFSVKIIAHQWYWSYEYSNFPNIKYDRFMKQTPNLSKGEFRLLETNNNIVLFRKVITQLLITSSDVIHSWTVPVLGVKLDATPGRLCQAACFPIYTGVFFGQCSEICGVNHSFIPVKLEVLSYSEMTKFIL
jgi:cytochrome c oxidase subunit 2